MKPSRPRTPRRTPPVGAAPPDVRWQTLRIEGREVLVLSHALAEGGEELAPLTTAQRDVVALVAEGMSNAEIARVRGSAVATVAKLLEGAYRRLGVHSRAELVARLPRRPRS